MKQLKRSLILLMSAGLLLCGCTPGQSGSVTTGTGTPASQTAGSGTTAAGAPESTGSDAETSESGTQTAADTQPEIPMDQPLNVGALFPKGGSVVLTGTGYVFARSGLNLRSQPTANSQKITLLSHGTTVKLKNAVCANIGKRHIPECWYQVEANGKTGFVSAEFVAAAFDAPPDSLDDVQRAALGLLLYRQAYKLLDYFFREGGIAATAKPENKMTDDGWYPLEPKGLTIEKLLADYAKYFSSAFPYPIEECYEQRGDTLYVAANYPENFYVDYDELTELNGTAGNSLIYKAVGHWFTTGEFVMITENNGLTEERFVLQFTDGAWKIAEFTPIL